MRNIVNGLNKILIVDDTPANVRLLSDILGPKGYKLYIATSGEQALQIAPRIDPDLILMDVMMPGIDGFETCARLKELEQFGDVPLIFITAKTDPADLSHGFEVGGVDYITKPINQLEVEARIQTHLRIRELILSQQNFITTLEGGIKDQKKELASMGHELRTPLNAIIGYSDMLLEDIDGFNSGKCSDCSDKVTAINTAGNYLLRLINDVLEVAKLDAGKMELHIEEFHLGGFLRFIESTVSPLAQKNGNMFQIVCDDGDRTLNMDPTKVKQIILNLLGNAAKFTRNGLIKLVVHFSDEGELIIEVKDDGIGMTSDQMARLFQEYRQADSSISGQYGGTGLGLTICKKLAVLMGGEIKVDSVLGEGTTFTVTLPTESAMNAAAGERDCA